MSSGAHPRSRGENNIRADLRVGPEGSSPLTRGKRCGYRRRGGAGRLIPAHAGKTRWKQRILQVWEAHPRSRGENTSPMSDLQTRDGSSPLTRGKLEVGLLGGGSLGLIPAHAGKTRLPWALAGPPQAHPRSRGENPPRLSPARQVPGSSPLTRGKHITKKEGKPSLGLIPAHAGKTFARSIRSTSVRAHPRSRGENPLYTVWPMGVNGLIPAHAGKTRPPLSRSRRARAHPRSRGENAHTWFTYSSEYGSSPLTRGKPRLGVRAAYGVGLIPAHAGKTPSGRSLNSATWAHPRSRGENPLAPGIAFAIWGSSPLTRGKQGRNVDLCLLRGLIPAHAGKTAAAGGTCS